MAKNQKMFILINKKIIILYIQYLKTNLTVNDSTRNIV